MRPLYRSWLYLPATRPDRFDKAVASGADAVVLDLEDAVPPDRKAAARREAAGLVSADVPVPVYVRVNSPRSRWVRDDVVEIASPSLAGVRVPKVEDPAEVRTVAGWLDDAATPAAIHCLVESARGVERAFAIATADPLVAGLALGEADLAADLGTAADEGLLYARSRCVVAARAAGLPPPVQSVFTNVRDLDGLRASCERGRRIGFLGRSAIHPDQVAVINEAYTPSASEVADARAELESAEHREGEGFVLPDGRFVDAAVTERARRTLQLGEAYGTQESSPGTTHEGRPS